MGFSCYFFAKAAISEYTPKCTNYTTSNLELNEHFSTALIFCFYSIDAIRKHAAMTVS